MTGLKISLKKTQIMFRDISSIPNICIGNLVLEVVENFVYLGTNINNNLALENEINSRMEKASSTMARLSKKVWKNPLLAISTKMDAYKACVFSTLLYASKSWTLYARQEARLNSFHFRCLRRILDTSWQDHILNKNILKKART